LGGRGNGVLLKLPMIKLDAEETMSKETK